MYYQCKLVVLFLHIFLVKVSNPYPFSIAWALIHFRNPSLLSFISFHFHFLDFWDNLVENWLSLLIWDQVLTMALPIFQVLICHLCFHFPPLLHLPLVHLQQVLATHSVDSSVSNKTLFTAVVPCQAERPGECKIWRRGNKLPKLGGINVETKILRTCEPPWQEPAGNKSHILLHEARRPDGQMPGTDFWIYNHPVLTSLCSTAEDVLLPRLEHHSSCNPYSARGDHCDRDVFVATCKHCRLVPYCHRKRWLPGPFGSPPSVRGLREFGLKPRLYCLWHLPLVLGKTFLRVFEHSVNFDGAQAEEHVKQHEEGLPHLKSATWKKTCHVFGKQCFQMGEVNGVF